MFVVSSHRARAVLTAFLFAAAQACSGATEGLGSAPPPAPVTPEKDSGSTEPPSSSSDGGSTPPSSSSSSSGGEPVKEHGAACANGTECRSGMCIAGTAPGAGVCARSCTQARANDCRDVGGLCVPFDAGGTVAFGCKGKLVTGPDADDAIIQVGDTVTRNLNPLSDVDVFAIAYPQGKWVIAVTPLGSNDVAFDHYDPSGDLQGSVNDGGAGAAESVGVTTSAAASYPSFIAVKNVGTLSGQYRISVTAAP